MACLLCAWKEPLPRLVLKLTSWCADQARGTLSEADAARVAHDVLQVLQECHRQGILYAVRPIRRGRRGPFGADTAACCLAAGVLLVQSTVG